jgi:hypothetical protein
LGSLLLLTASFNASNRTENTGSFESQLVPWWVVLDAALTSVLVNGSQVIMMNGWLHAVTTKLPQIPFRVNTDSSCWVWDLLVLDRAGFSIIIDKCFNATPATMSVLLLARLLSFVTATVKLRSWKILK